MDLLKPKEIEIDLPDGGKKTYIISKFPAVTGREIITQYPITGAPKIGEYHLNEELMFKLMRHVAVPIQGKEHLRLESKALVENHVPDWETLVKLEWAVMEYNCSFFQAGKISDILDFLLPKAEGLISKILTQFVDSLSEKEKRHSKN